MSPKPLLPDSEALDQIRVAFRVLALQVIQEAAALADELEQPAARVMVLRVRLEMVGQVIDSLTEERDLNFGGTRVAVVRSIAADDFGLAVLAQHLSSTYGPEPSARRRRTRPPLRHRWWLYLETNQHFTPTLSRGAKTRRTVARRPRAGCRTSRTDRPSLRCRPLPRCLSPPGRV